MRCYILGASGFIGRNVAAAFERRGHDVVRLCRPLFDYTNPETQKQLDFSGACVVDCVTRVDGTPGEVRWTIVDGLQLLLRQPTIRNANSYIYLSTSTTLSPDVVRDNVYVASKRDAEKLVQKLPQGQIVRLTYPFGPGENEHRLITRLISQALRSECLTIGDIVLPLTPIECLAEWLPEIALKGGREKNVTDGRVYHLWQIAETVIAAMKRGSYKMDLSNKANYTVLDPYVCPCSVDALELVRVMALKIMAKARGDCAFGGIA